MSIGFCLNCGEKLKTPRDKYCSKKKNCQSEYNYKQFLTKWKNGEEQGRCGKFGVSKHIRKYLFEKYDNKCSECGWNKVHPQTNVIPLQMDHINGDFLDNREENLTLLCPNCHVMTETYGALNKGNGRKGRSYR